MATPHRGADYATSFIGRLGTRLTNIPSRIRKTRSRLRQVLRSKDPNELDRGIGGIADLAPDNKTTREINTWKFPPELPIHSIIGNTKEPDTPGGNDGMVNYESSHLDGVASEKIVESDHSVHWQPEAILEVLRILHLHLEEFQAEYPETP